MFAKVEALISETWTDQDERSAEGLDLSTETGSAAAARGPRRASTPTRLLRLQSYRISIRVANHVNQDGVAG